MSNYWDKRAANRMYEDMKTAEEAAEDIRKLYGRASRYIQLQGENIFEAFRRQTGLTEDEARYLLTHAKSPKDVQMVIEFAKQIQDPAKRQQLLNWIKASATQSRLARLAELQESIDKLLPLLYMRELQYHQNVYQKIIQDAYLHKTFDIQQYSGYGKYVTPMDDKRIDKLMRERWLGSNYSSRLWGNTNRLAEAVRDELMVSFLTGRPQKEAWQAIDAEFNKGAHAARRLVRTESNYLANQGHAEAYKDSGVEKYIYVATLDMKTSEICRSLDGRTFFVKNAQPGRNYPPMHPWCRSTTIAWIPDALLAKMKRTARDPVTGKNYTVPANMTYNEWYEKYVKGSPQAAAQEKAQRNRGADTNQHKKYRAILKDKIPDTVEKFQDLKYNNNDTWDSLKQTKQKALNEMDFKDMSDLVGQLGNKEVREWYKAHDDKIPDLIDKTKTLEEQARQAHELRNEYRTQARDLMKDQETRKELDESHPNPTFEQLMEHKKIKYGMNDEEAYKDIIRSSTTTNREFDEKAGVKNEGHEGNSSGPETKDDSVH